MTTRRTSSNRAVNFLQLMKTTAHAGGDGDVNSFRGLSLSRSQMVEMASSRLLRPPLPIDICAALALLSTRCWHDQRLSSDRSRFVEDIPAVHRMSRTHNLGRSDHDHLSLRVALQMQHAVSSAIAQRSRERLHHDIVVIDRSMDHVHQRSIHSLDGAVAFHGDAGLVRVGLQDGSSEMHLETHMRQLFGRSIVVVCDVLLRLLGKSGTRIRVSSHRSGSPFILTRTR